MTEEDDKRKSSCQLYDAKKKLYHTKNYKHSKTQTKRVTRNKLRSFDQIQQQQQNFIKLKMKIIHDFFKTLTSPGVQF